jgi:hypothetical protein
MYTNESHEYINTMGTDTGYKSKSEDRWNRQLLKLRVAQDLCTLIEEKKYSATNGSNSTFFSKNYT